MTQGSGRRGTVVSVERDGQGPATERGGGAGGLHKDGEEFQTALARSKRPVQIADARGVRQTMSEGLYARAFALARIGQSGRAADLFYLLCALDGQRAEHWLGLGLSLRSLDLGAYALIAYEVAARLAPHSAAPQFHRMECLIYLGRWDEARSALCAFELVARDDEDAGLIAAAVRYRKALELRSRDDVAPGPSMR